MCLSNCPNDVLKNIMARGKRSLSPPSSRIIVHLHVLACLLVCLLIAGCASKAVPIQVKGKVRFGKYSILPPIGFWYFPRKFPDQFRTSKNLFLITFWENKALASGTSSPARASVFFNFAVTTRTYGNLAEYYKSAARYGIKYDELPNEAGILKSSENWSCKQLVRSVYGIECTSLGEQLVTVGIYGESKNNVFSKLPVLKQMIDSIKLQ